MFSDILSPVLFSPSVPAHQAALEPGDLDAGLHYGLLLEPSLAFLDSSFFAIPAYERHVKASRERGHGESWLEMGLREGAIVPLVREDVSQFSDVLEVLIRDKYVGVSKRQREFAEMLGEKVAKTQVWPSPQEYGFGIELAKRIQAVFLSDIAPMAKGLSSEAALAAMQVWSETREWRERWITRAIDKRYQLSGEGHGLRLMDVIQVAGQDILGSDSVDIRTTDELLKESDRVLSRDKQKLLRALLVLFDHEWLKNFCDGMNKSRVSLGLTRPRWHHVVSILDADADYRRKEGKNLEGNGASLGKIRIELPSVELLKAAPAYVLKNIWRNGEDYFTALERWRSDPSNKNMERLAEQLIAYSRMAVSSIRAQPEQRQRYKLVEVLPEDLISTLAAISGGLIAYSTGASAPEQVLTGASAGLVSTIVLRPVFKKAELVRGVVRLKSKLPGQSVASQISQSKNLFGRRIDVNLSPFKRTEDKK